MMPVDPHERVRIRLLGPVELVCETADLGGPTRRLILATLALRRAIVVPVGELVEAVWTDAPPPDQRSLQVHVSRLRRALAAAGVSGGIEHRAGGYVLDCDLEEVDAAAFERGVADGIDALPHDPERARDHLQRVLGLWRGRPLGGVPDGSSLRAEVVRLEDVRRRAHRARLDADLALGRHLDVVAELQQLTVEDPLEEPFWAQLVLALYRSDRQAEALAAYARARTVLADELGVDPSPGLQELHRRVLAQDPQLAAASSAGASAGAGPAAATRLDPRAVAVLPFEVAGGSADVELLAIGLHTDLLKELSRVGQLDVISRRSVLGYRDGASPPRAIAQELQVGTIVTGSLQAAGTRFRLTVQLVDGTRGSTRWVESYDDEITASNLFAVQADLARDIADSLAAELRPAGVVTSPATNDLDAYRFVAAGRRQFELKTEDGFVQAIACYEEAVRADPTYATAWIGLSDALVSMDAYGHGDRHDLLPRAERAVHRALALDPDSAEARTALGVLAIGYQDGPAALMELRRATRVRAGHADAHNWHSWASLLVGEADPALVSARRAVRLDPRSAEANAHLGLALAATGDPAAGLQATRVAQRLSPYATASLYEALCLYELGELEAARDRLLPLADLPTPGPLSWSEGGPMSLLAVTLHELGDVEGAEEVVAGIDGHLHPFAAALAHLAGGRVDEAMRALALVDRVTAWPALVTHHYLRRVWARPGAGEVHEWARSRARRGWGCGDPAV